jgi:hypothetical protein
MRKNFWSSWSVGKMNRGGFFALIILIALAAFEVFNYSSTVFALRDILGNLTFGGMEWAVLLAFAFCAIDFAGIARIFTPEQGQNEPAEVWYLLAAWFLAAAFNASLTWWGISVAIFSHNNTMAAVLGNASLNKILPVFMALMVLLIRVLLINTFAIAGERIFSTAQGRSPDLRPARTEPTYRPATTIRGSQTDLRPPTYNHYISNDRNRE